MAVRKCCDVQKTVPVTQSQQGYTTHNDICFLFTQHLNNWWTESDSLSILSTSFPEPIFESDTRRKKEKKIL